MADKSPKNTAKTTASKSQERAEEDKAASKQGQAARAG